MSFDNQTVAANTAGVGTANNVGFVSVVASAESTFNGNLVQGLVSGAQSDHYLNRPDTSNPPYGRTMYMTGGVVKWQAGPYPDGGEYYHVHQQDVGDCFAIHPTYHFVLLGLDIASNTSKALLPHRFYTAAPLENVANISNFDNTGFSAFVFDDNTQHEMGALGFGNDGDTVLQTKACLFIERSGFRNGNTVPTRMVINESYDSAINNWMVFDTDGSFYVMQEQIGLAWDPSTLVMDQTKVKWSVRDSGMRNVAVDIDAVTATEAGEGTQAYHDGGLYLSVSGSWVLLQPLTINNYVISNDATRPGGLAISVAA